MKITSIEPLKPGMVEPAPSRHTFVLLISDSEPGGRKGWKPLHAFNCTDLNLLDVLGDAYYPVRIEHFARPKKTLIYLEKV